VFRRRSYHSQVKLIITISENYRVIIIIIIPKIEFQNTKINYVDMLKEI
jgi:hypothetical protein